MAGKDKLHSDTPLRAFYTLKQAAIELNLHFNRTDLDESYLVHLGATGKIALHCYTEFVLVIENEKFPDTDVIKTFQITNQLLESINGCFMRVYAQDLTHIEMRGRADVGISPDIVILSNYISSDVAKMLQEACPSLNQYEQKSSVLKYKTGEFIPILEILNDVAKVYQEEDLINKNSSYMRYYFQYVEFYHDDGPDENNLYHEFPKELITKDKLFIFNGDLNNIKNNNFTFTSTDGILRGELNLSDHIPQHHKKPIFVEKNANYRIKKSIAERIAKKIIREDTEKKLRAKELCVLVHEQLINLLDYEDLPENDDVIRNWIRETIRPHSYLSKGGRPSVKKNPLESHR